ncbi:MAG: hypothetical protein ACFE0O_02635 [Opitutales bacterium]
MRWLKGGILVLGVIGAAPGGLSAGDDPHVRLEAGNVLLEGVVSGQVSAYLGGPGAPVSGEAVGLGGWLGTDLVEDTDAAVLAELLWYSSRGALVQYFANQPVWEEPGAYAVALGRGSLAPGNDSLALGAGSHAGGAGSLALAGGVAGADASGAIGKGSAAWADGAWALGTGLVSDRPQLLALGRFNAWDPQAGVGPVPEDGTVLVVGSGDSADKRRNALTLSETGDLALAGDLSLVGDGAGIRFPDGTVQTTAAGAKTGGGLAGLSVSDGPQAVTVGTDGTWSATADGIMTLASAEEVALSAGAKRLSLNQAGDLQLIDARLVWDGWRNSWRNRTDDIGRGEVLRFQGITSAYIQSVQDGTGRVQQYWNSTTSRKATYLVSNEGAGRILFNPIDTNQIPFYSLENAPRGQAGERIFWRKRFVVLGNGNTGIGVNRPQTRLHVGGDVRAEGDVATTGTTTTGSLKVGNTASFGDQMTVDADGVAAAAVSVTGDASVAGDLEVAGRLLVTEIVPQGNIPVGIFSGVAP